MELLAVGSFGRRVAHELGGLLADAQCPSPMGALAIDSRAVATPSLRVLCAWRHPGSIAHELDASAFGHGGAWLPVIGAHPFARIGPLITARSSWCYGCVETREAQHHADPNSLVALRTAYADDSGSGPGGYLECGAALTAASASSYLAGARSKSAASREGCNTVVWINLSRHETTIDRVVGVHDCPRCGLHRDARARLTQDLQELSRSLRSQ